MQINRARALRFIQAPTRSIRWKIILPFIALTLVIAGAGTYLTTRVVAGSLAERFDNQLVEAARVASDTIARRERKHLEVVRAVSFTEGVAAAAANGDRSGLERLVLPVAVNSSLDRVEVLDSDGKLLYGVRLADAQTLDYQAITAAETYTQWQPVEKQLQGSLDRTADKFTGIVSTGEGHVFYTSGPLYLGDRKVGVVLIGSRTAPLLAATKLEALADVSLFGPDGAVVASTFVADAANQGVDLTLDEAVMANLGSDSVVRETREVSGRQFDVLYSPLTVRGTPVGAIGIALPSAFIANAAGVTRLQMTLLFSAATAGVLAIGWVLSNSIMRPIRRLALTASQVAAGDLTVRSGLVLGDEVGVFARTFDTMTSNLQRQHLGTVRALASAIDARDPYTLGHSVRVGRLAAEIGRGLGLSQVALQHLEIGGYLHDIGKIGVRDSVLLKAGDLTAEERHLIEDHPRIGLRIVESIQLPNEVLQIIGEHHERLDGKGYPLGLKGDELKIFPRIASVADIYDALTTDRPYRAALKVDEVVEVLDRQAKAGVLDQAVVDQVALIASAWECERAIEPALQGVPLLDGTLAMAS